ncbi:MAG TPA: hypothetical protein PLB91_12470 [Spirochaetales bacterium]|nr:hypothetical protein [Spirochaetales bacterium]HRY56424.1 hypothetical protein [Spirochaetia bacterium]HRZ65827.1 hypothetical protein [Spirochaetia bacterium]
MPELLASCARPAWDFARVEELWARFSPLTPYGRDEKERRLVYADRSALEELYDLAEEAARDLAASSQASRDRVTYHLRRVPRLPFPRPGSGEADGERPSLELIEVFQVKKFLANYRAVAGLCGEAARSRFGLGFRAAELAALLDRGGSDPETFFVADSYHPGLPALRAEIASVDEELRRSRAAAKSAALAERGLDFGFRDFLVLPHERASGLLDCACGEARFSVEAYDGSSCVVRLQDGPASLLLAERRDELAARERELEAEALAGISEAIGAAAAELYGYADALREYDLARARALLAAELGCVRPELGSPSLAVEGGRFLPLEGDCLRLSLAYAPLTVEIGESAAVLFGSNMGGKTVALQSLLFFQLAAQAGLFVPARRFATAPYPVLRYVGELRVPAAPGSGPAGAAPAGEGPREGLSGFGFEIRAFVEAWEAARPGGAFLVFDEFARTTSSAEAEAILSAALGGLLGLPGARALFSTHFRGVARLPGVRYLRMRGLDRDEAARSMLSGEPAAERIRRINRMMRYEILEAEEDSGDSDAIAIASLLGLDEGVSRAAAERYAARGRLGDARGKET